MKTLLLMRHAKSSWDEKSLSDHQRPLNSRGKRDAPRMGAYVQSKGIILDAVLSSTAERARATIEGFLEEYDFEGEVSYFDDLYHANHETYASILNQLPDEVETVMLVGHNPEMDYFLEVICDVYEHMTTANVAVINLSVERWAELNEITPGELVSLWRPREI
jgi:phosphohistidine phosphatase